MWWEGYAFSGKVLLAIVFPGPILLLEGKANLLKDRSELHGEEEPNFRALAVLDNRAGSFLFGLDFLVLLLKIPGFVFS